MRSRTLGALAVTLSIIARPIARIFSPDSYVGIVLATALWIVSLAMVIVLLSRFTEYMRQRLTTSVASEDRCNRCGYDLRATPDRCPECGTGKETMKYDDLPLRREET